MDTKNQTKSNKIRSFVKRGIFFKVPKDEKNYVKNELMQDDHISFRRSLVAVIIFQLIMIIIKAATYSSIRDGYYLICYSALAVGCGICYLVSESQAKKGYYNGYFITVAIAVNVFLLWSLGITIIDCMKWAELTTFAYVSLALASFVILEPWVFYLNTVAYVTVLNVSIYLIKGTIYSSVLISSISIAVLTILVATVNFSRRIKATILKKQVTELNDILTRHAYYDELTSIYNRRYLTEHINDKLNVKTSPSGAIMFDIDDFKLINDNYGHQNGDICLSVLGDIINEFIKTIPDSYAVRYGGEEFLIFIPRTKDFLLKQEAEKLRVMVNEQEIELQDKTKIHLSISIGASLAKPGLSYYKLIEKADDNLYVAKSNGKNIVYFE